MGFTCNTHMTELGIVKKEMGFTCNTHMTEFGIVKKEGDNIAKLAGPVKILL